MLTLITIERGEQSSDFKESIWRRYYPIIDNQSGGSNVDGTEGNQNSKITMLEGFQAVLDYAVRCLN